MTSKSRSGPTLLASPQRSSARIRQVELRWLQLELQQKLLYAGFEGRLR